MRASFSLFRKPRPKGQWADPSRREFHPYWGVAWYLAGEKRQESGERVAPGSASVCPSCLVAEKVETGGCVCQAPLMRACDRWLREWLRTAQQAAREGRIEVLRELRAPRRKVKFGKVVDLYLVTGPRDARARVAALRSIIEESTGERLEDVEVERLDAGLVRRWAQLRQEHFRRGWSRNRGRDAPRNAWQVLRRELAEGRLPALDKRTGMPCNTTIRSYLGDAKSILGKLSRAEYLREIAGELPPLEQFEAMVVDVSVQRGRQLDVGAYELMLAAAEGLRGEDPQLWLAFELARRLGPRTIELRHLREHWLEEDDLGRTFLVIRNRPEEGFELKAWRRDLERPLEVPRSVVSVMREVQCAEVGTGFVSLLGTPTRTAAEKLMRRLSKWIRQFVPEGEQTIYLFRKLVISQRAALDGMAAAQAGAGHVPGSSVTGSHYVALAAPVRALSDEELSPEAIRGARRRRPGADGAA